MSSIEVLSPGLLTTVQDLGRDGFGPIGVSPSGAADGIALRLGSRLVGNPEGAAALEMTLVGDTFRFPEAAIVALTGSDFGATLDGECLECYESVEIRPGQIVKLGATRSGARCYLCVRGGIEVEPFLRSASTYLPSKLGGFEGRALQKGDVLQVGATAPAFRKRRIGPHVMRHLAERGVLRVTPGPQADWFNEPAVRSFYESVYKVGEQSNRMGLRFEGKAIGQAAAKSMVTEGVSLGAVQIPPSGVPIVLFVDQQTTGGYPKIANVISADLHRVGQLRPRDEIRFERVTFAQARSLLIEQERMLASSEAILA